MSKSLRDSGRTNRYSQYRVLVADDDAGCRDSLVSLLIHDGFRASSVSRGQQAILEIQRTIFRQADAEISPKSEDPPQSAGLRSYDFAVFDYNLPDLTGLEILRVVRRDLRLQLPAIMVTGEFSPELEREVLAIGGFAVMKKPVKPEHFREIVWDLVASHFDPS